MVYPAFAIEYDLNSYHADDDSNESSEHSQIVSTSDGTLDVGIYTIPEVPNTEEPTKLKIDFLKSGTERILDIDGPFIEMGSKINLDFVKHLVKINSKGEIEIESGGMTSHPAIFAAGDATTIPYNKLLLHVVMVLMLVFLHLIILRN